MSLSRIAVAASTMVLLVVVLISAVAAAVVEAVTSPLDNLFDSAPGSENRVLPAADGEIPLRMFELYREAAATCAGLSWTLLAGFGEAASDHARHIGDRGVMGLGRNEFDKNSSPVPAGGESPASPFDPVDAVFATARAICRSGPATDVRAVVGHVEPDPATAVRIIELEDLYLHAPRAGSFVAAAARSAPSGAARLAVEYAGAQLGLPYVWGGDGPDRTSVTGFDCSGLTQSAFQAAGIAIPRTATDQFATGRPVGASDIQAGDLVFYGDPRGFLHHVAIYLGRGLVIDAPHPGAVVRLDPVAADDYAGARRES